MKSIERFIELFFSLIALIIAQKTTNYFFNESFCALLFFYFVIVLLELPIENVVKERLKNFIYKK